MSTGEPEILIFRTAPSSYHHPDLKAVALAPRDLLVDTQASVVENLAMFNIIIHHCYMIHMTENKEKHDGAIFPS